MNLHFDHNAKLLSSVKYNTFNNIMKIDLYTNNRVHSYKL